MSGQDVEHNTGRMDVVGERFCTGGFHGFKAISEHSCQDIDHLPVAAGLAFQFAPDAA